MSVGLLDQRSPLATTETVLHIVPAGMRSHLASISICNASGAPATFRLIVAGGGKATDATCYLFYECPLDIGETLQWSNDEETVLTTGDAIRVYASAANLAFIAWGNLEVLS